jgi:Uma2 family endonuclease
MDSPTGPLGESSMLTGGEYLAAGGREVWVADPEARRITVHCPDERPRELGPDDTLDGGDLLPGFDVPVDKLFV